DFLGRVEREGIPWPSEWKERPGAGYPEPGQSIRQIPEEDQKYIGLVLSVKDRRPREELVSDRAAVEALREISDRLEAVRGTQKWDARNESGRALVRRTAIRPRRTGRAGAARPRPAGPGDRHEGWACSAGYPPWRDR